MFGFFDTQNLTSSFCRVSRRFSWPSRNSRACTMLGQTKATAKGRGVAGSCCFLPSTRWTLDAGGHFLRNRTVPPKSFDINVQTNVSCSVWGTTYEASAFFVVQMWLRFCCDRSHVRHLCRSQSPKPDLSLGSAAEVDRDRLDKSELCV